MLSEDIAIEIDSISNMDGETTESHIKSYGKRYLKNQKIYISYNEKMDGIDEPVPSLITLDENHIVIARRGAVRSTMKFVSREDTRSQYVTSVGTIDLLLHTNRYCAILRENSVEIYLDYAVKMNNVDSGNNSVHIMISSFDKCVQ